MKLKPGLHRFYRVLPACQNYFLFGVAVPNVARPGMFGVPTNGHRGTTWDHSFDNPPCKLGGLIEGSKTFSVSCVKNGFCPEGPRR